MDFNLDILQRKGDVLRIAISHYYKHPSGDMIADPDMEVRVNRKTETAEALTYQDTYGYQEVYSEDVPKWQVGVVVAMHAAGMMDVMALRTLNEVTQPVRCADVGVLKHRVKGQE